MNFDMRQHVSFSPEVSTIIYTINPILGDGGQFDHSTIHSVTIFLALGPGSPKFLTLLQGNMVSIW